MKHLLTARAAIKGLALILSLAFVGCVTVQPGHQSAEARAIVSNVVAQAELPEKEAQRARIAAEIAAKQAELNKLAP